MPEVLRRRNQVPDPLFLVIGKASLSVLHIPHINKEVRTHELFHLWEAALDLSIPDELPASPSFLPLVPSRVRTWHIFCCRVAEKQPDAKPTAGLGRIPRHESNRPKTRRGGRSLRSLVGRGVDARRESQKEFGLRPCRAV